MRKLLLLLVALAVLGCGGTSDNVSVNPPLPGGSPINPIGRLEFYLLANNLDARGINVFRVNTSTGSLSAVPGSPFAVGTNMVQSVYSPSGRFVFGSDVTTSGIQGLRIEPTTGALTALPGFPVASLANATVALDLDGNHLYVVGETSLDGFQVNPSNGSLSRLAGFPMAVPGMTDAYHGRFAPNGFFYVVDAGSAQLLTFSHSEATGALTLVGQIPTGNAAPLAFELDELGRFLYVAGSDGTLQGFGVASNGTLTRLSAGPGIPFGPAGRSTFDFSIRDGILYIGDTISDSLSAFRVGSTGLLTQVSGYPVTGGGASVLAYPTFPTSFLYISNRARNSITAFGIDANANRSPVPGSPFTAAGSPTILVPVEVAF